MNSLVNGSQQYNAQSTKRANNFKPETASFTINPPNTTLHIQRSINLLTSLHDQDIFAYRKDFYEVINLCKWNSQVANEVLISLTSSSLLQHYNECNTLEEKFSALLKAKYPPSDALKFYTQLTTIKQSDFVTVKEYKDKIEEICKNLSVCKEWN
jgi:hypothetical protein